MTTRIPVDSTDAREIREAEAEQEARAHALELEQQRNHATRCRRGWLGEDECGRPIPCPICRPHLRRIACRTCGAPPTTCDPDAGPRRGACCVDCDHAGPTGPSPGGRAA